MAMNKILVPFDFSEGTDAGRLGKYLANGLSNRGKLMPVNKVMDIYMIVSPTKNKITA